MTEWKSRASEQICVEFGQILFSEMFFPSSSDIEWTISRFDKIELGIAKQNEIQSGQKKNSGRENKHEN